MSISDTTEGAIRMRGSRALATAWLGSQTAYAFEGSRSTERTLTGRLAA